MLRHICPLSGELGHSSAHRIPHGGDPLWLQFVSPPSSGKTEILQSLTDCPEVYKLSSLTGQTFVSGVKGKNSSLIDRLDAQGLLFLLLKDFTTVLSLHRDARSEILGALREIEIYDGEYSKDFGNGQSVSWSGRLGFLAGVTPVIDRHHQVVAVLGQRFLMLDFPRRNGTPSPTGRWRPGATRPRCAPSSGRPCALSSTA